MHVNMKSVRTRNERANERTSRVGQIAMDLVEFCVCLWCFCANFVNKHNLPHTRKLAIGKSCSVFQISNRIASQRRCHRLFG